MFHQHTKGVIRDIRHGSMPTFLLANRGFQVHAQVLITSWVVIAILLCSAAIADRNPQTIPTDG